MTINREKLALLDSLTIHSGGHDDFEDGHCSMELVAWLADEGHTDTPECASPVIARYTIRLNDRWSTEKRQALKPYLIRMIGTGGDGKDAIRVQIALNHAATLTAEWLDLAGIDATAVRAAKNESDLHAALRTAGKAAWKLRQEKVAELKAAILERLRDKPAADAAAVAAAVADAAAVAVAAAAADAVADWSPWGDNWTRVYHAVRDHFRKNPLPIAERVKDLAAKHDAQSLDLLDKLIDANEEFGA